MKIENRIKYFKQNLVKKASSKGLYENFGQLEVRKLRDEFPVNYSNSGKREMDLIQEFNEWVLSFSDKDLSKVVE